MSLEVVNLTGHLLIAMPNLTDPYFAKSVSYICMHNQDGAMGVMINRPSDMTYETLFEKINLTISPSEANNSDVSAANQKNLTVFCEHILQKPVLLGGPVQPDRGFILHPFEASPDMLSSEAESPWDSSITIANHTALTTSKDILEAVATGTGPQKMLLSLGYAGWNPGQLEAEIAQNSWLSVSPKTPEALHKILFDTPHEVQLEAALAELGVNYAMLSDVAGHA